MREHAATPSGSPVPDDGARLGADAAAGDARPGISAAPRLDPWQIVRQVDAALAGAEGSAMRLAGDGHAAPDGAAGGGLARWQGVPGPDPWKREFVLSELLQPSDEAFVRTAYRAVLRRDPDEAGLAHYLDQLRRGDMTKVEILGTLRWAPEGKARSVHIDGLLAPYLFQKWRKAPVLGPIVAWAHAAARLGSLVQRQEASTAASAHEVQVLGSTVNDLSRQLQSRLDRLEAARERDATDLAARVEGVRRELLAPIEQMQTQVEDGTARIARQDLQLARHGTDVAAQREALVGQGKELATHREVLSGQGRELATHREALANQGTELAAHREALAVHGERLADHGTDLASHREKLGGLGDELAAHRGQLSEHARTIADHNGQLGRQDRELASHREQLHGHGEELAGHRQQLGGHGRQLHGHGEELAAHRSAIRGHAVILGQMEQARTDAKAGAHALDPLYADFEAKFRGSRELVRERATPYLAFVREAGAGTADAPLLDLGCGRGEWLELLRDNGLVARGVDNNEVFVGMCRDRGLDVIEGDVIEVMGAMPDGSLGAVSGMHIAEHLPFEVLVRLIDESLRLLRPGGLLFLETPNPENLQVATHYFYMDPTHRNPLPPEALQWIVQARGFPQVHVERLTHARETPETPFLDEDLQGAGSVNALLSQMVAAPDYAVVARRSPT